CALYMWGPCACRAGDVQLMGMLGMHGKLEATLAMRHADLIICVGARFDDRITGRLSDFCPHASKIHIDIDPGSIDKVVRADVALVGDCYPLLRALRKELSAHGLPAGRLDDWWQRIGVWRAQECLKVTPQADAILPQH